MLRTSSPILASALFFGIALPCSAADAHLAVLEQFRRFSPDEFGRALERRRPPLVGPEEVEAITAALPKEGEAKRLTVSDRQKLESIPAVLRVHGREQVYLVKVVDSPQARLGLHARFVVLVTNTALQILSQAQIQAMVAHEIGHEYVWDEYDAAWRKGDWSRMRALEFFCDGVALVTLARIGANPEALTDGLRILEASERLNAVVLEHRPYPSWAERAKFAREILKWLEAGSGSIRAH